MADESGNKLQDRQRHSFFRIGIMVEVFIGNGCTVIEFNTGFTKRGTFDIFAKIVNIGFHVI